jgi:hypothetical protein
LAGAIASLGAQNVGPQLIAGVSAVGGVVLLLVA